MWLRECAVVQFHMNTCAFAVCAQRSGMLVNLNCNACGYVGELTGCVRLLCCHQQHCGNTIDIRMCGLPQTAGWMACLYIFKRFKYTYGCAYMDNTHVQPGLPHKAAGWLALVYT